MLIEFERGRPIIVDRALYRELVKGAIKRTHDDLEAKAATAAQEKKAARASKQPADPVTAAKRERDAQLRELADQAHGANLDLGHALVHNLADRRPGRHRRRPLLRLRAARRRPRQLPLHADGRADRADRRGGIRLVVEELRADVTKTRKDGSRGRLRIDYGDYRDPQAALAWLWKFIDGAKTAGELYGRALVVIAAEQHATRLVVPSSQRMPASRWSSHKDIAAKALKKLAGPHVPASLTKLEQAVKRAHSAYDKAETAAREQHRAAHQPAETEPADSPVDDGLDADLSDVE